MSVDYKKQLGLLDEILVNPRDTGALLELRRMILSDRWDMSQAISVTPDHEKLPAIVQRPGKKLRSIDVKCRKCGARPGSPCVKAVGKNKGKPMPGSYHDQRKGDAGVIGTRPGMGPKPKGGR